MTVLATTIEVRETSYSIRGKELVESTEKRMVDVHLVEADSGEWINFVRGFQGLPLEKAREAVGQGRDWCAQMGTKPIYMEPCPHPEDAPLCCGSTCENPRGGWGGRNYSEIVVPVAELERAISELVP